MRGALFIGTLAVFLLGGAGAGSAQTHERSRLSVLKMDTNTVFNFLPPDPNATATNKEAAAIVPPSRWTRLPRDGAAPVEKVRQTVGRQPGEKEADQQQRSSFTHDLAASEERARILSSVTTSLLPEEPLEEAEAKEGRNLWISAKSKGTPSQGSPVARLPFDTWVLPPSQGGAAEVPTPADPLFVRPPQKPTATPFDLASSPFDLAPATKPVTGSGILSAKPLDVPLFGVSRGAAATTRPTPPGLLPPSPSLPPLPTAAATPPPSAPSRPFPNVEFTRDSPFAARPSSAGVPFGTSPGATPPRPVVVQPFPKEISRQPPKTRDELATEKWEKYFEERKRNF
ncbi:MAG: hypothetical protein IT578_08205 [Verrucomicrobiae bacterium]|nr:hypothetical protein [Verrucomicrobiae bacterium]